MKVILLQDIDKIGKKHDVKEITDGYARNFLIPKGLVKQATEENMKKLEAQKETLKEKEEEDLKKIQSVASSLEGQEVIISVKVGDEKQLFEAVTAQKVLEKLKEMGFEVKKNQLLFSSPIKELGEFPVKIRFSHNLEVEIKIIITEAKEE